MDPQWWITHPFQGIPLVQWVPLVPLLHLFQVVWSYPSDLYVLVVPYDHLLYFLLQKDHLGPLGDPLHHPFHFLCYCPIPMVLPYWLKPDYWRLPIQFLHQCHPPHFPPHLIHHPFYHLEDLPYLVVEFLPHPLELCPHRTWVS